MIDLDLERLAVDRAYWDSVAPAGAEAFIDNIQWSKWDGGGELIMLNSHRERGWSKSKIPYSKKRYESSNFFTIITRPEPKSERSEKHDTL